MFESDDWDFDEECLKDADNKAITFYSQTSCEDDNNYHCGNKPKLEEQKQECIRDIKFQDKKLDAVHVEKDEEFKKSKSSRENLISSILKQDSTEKQPKAISMSISCGELKTSSGKITCTPGSSIVTSANRPKTVNCHPLINSNGNNTNKLHERKLPSDNTNILFSNAKYNNKSSPSRKNQDSPNLNYAKMEVPVVEETRSIYFRCDTHNKDTKDTLENLARKQLLQSLFHKLDKQEASVFKAEKQVSEKLTLRRTFPGPAGLLPDNIDTSVPSISDLKDLDENENDTVEKSNESHLSEYCSQHTKNLFTEGAWQFMLADLPTNFPSDYNISMIKQTAIRNGYTHMKVPYLAGMLVHIDFSHENPLVVLKDFTDSIRGIMHRDIPLKYPGILEPNVVILLQDTGLLRTSASKYQVIISPTHLLGIYSNKGKLVEASLMRSNVHSIPSNERVAITTSNENKLTQHSVQKTQFTVTDSLAISINSVSNIHEKQETTCNKNASDISYETNEIIDSALTEISGKNIEAKRKFVPTIEESDINAMENKVKISLQSLQKFSNICNTKNLALKRSNDTSHSTHISDMSESTSFNDSSFDRDFCTSLKSVTNSQNWKDFSDTSSNSKQVKLHECKSGLSSKYPFAYKENEGYDTGETIPICATPEITTFNNRFPQSDEGILITAQKWEATGYNALQKCQSNEKIQTRVRQKLLQYRSNDVLTPNLSQNTVNLTALGNKQNDQQGMCNKNLSIIKKDICADMLGDDDDSADELLSQLDVNSIIGNSSGKN